MQLEAAPASDRRRRDEDRSFVRSRTPDLEGRRLRVNLLSPGATETPGLSGLAKTEDELEQIKAGLVTQIPLGRLADPIEIANASSSSLMAVWHKYDHLKAMIGLSDRGIRDDGWNPLVVSRKDQPIYLSIVKKTVAKKMVVFNY